MNLAKRLGVACALTILLPAAAHAAPGVDLTYGACPTAGPHTAAIDCSLGQTAQFIGTVTMPSAMPDLQSMTLQLTFDFGSNPVPAFWDFATSGENETAISTSHVKTSCGPEYLGVWGTLSGNSGFVASSGPHSVSVLVTCYRTTTISVAAGQQLFGFSLFLDTSGSAGAGGGLDGCSSPVSAYVDWVRMEGASGDKIFSGPALTGDFVQLNGAAAPLTITASASSGGKVSLPNPPDIQAAIHTVHVASGGSRVFTITPDFGSAVTGVMVDGIPVGPVTSYTFSNVTSNHTLSATFFRPFTDIGAGLAAVKKSSVAWGDYDNDGILDCVLTGLADAGPVSRIYRNSGGANPTFTDIGAGLAGVSDGSVTWGDYDNDGDLDLLLTGVGVSDRVSKIYQNSGGPSPTFTDIGAALTAVSTSSVTWGDYDNDGDLDILLSGSTVSGAAVSLIYRNSGGANPSFTEIGAGLTGVSTSSVAWGDYDGDGDLDILLTGMSSSAPVSKLYRNNGGASPTFTDAAAGLVGVRFSSVAWGDFDADGDLDILLTGDTGSGYVSRIYRNNGGANPTFTDLGAGLTGVALSSAAWGDYDNDGDLDVVLSGSTGASFVTKIYRNSGGANPGLSDVAAALTGVGQSSIAWGDYDNDGDLDLLATGDSGSGSLSRIYAIVGAPSNAAPLAPAALSTQVTGGLPTFNWVPGSDSQTPASGLSYQLRVGTSAGAFDILSPAAALPAGTRRVACPGPVPGNRSWTMPLSNKFHSNPYWSVQSVDGAFAGSPFAAEQRLILSATVQNLADVPADQGGWLYLTMNRSPMDDPDAALPVATYGIWRRVAGSASLRAGSMAAMTAKRSLAVESAELQRMRAALPGDLPVLEQDGVILVTGSRTGAATNAANPFPPGTWALVANVPALQQAQYVVAVATISNVGANDFVVTANTTTPSIWFASDAASGQSSDNLAPAIPAPFSGSYSTGAAHLTWGANGEHDLAGYKLYRGATADFTPGPANLLGTLSTTSYDDAAAISGSYFKLAAVDVNGNTSAYATTQAGGLLGVGDDRAFAFALEGARPNPSHGNLLNVSFSLPASGSARLELLDMSGRRVVVRDVGSLGAGRHTVRLTAEHALAPGLYWLRLAQATRRQTVRVTVLE